MTFNEYISEEYIMADTTLCISADSEIVNKAQVIFASQGIDLSQAINGFLLKTVSQNEFPYDFLTEPKPGTVSRALKMDCLRGVFITSDDFDEPLDDFKEYME